MRKAGTASSRPAAVRPGRCSIVVPTFNRAALLPATIAAIAAQRYGDWELIVVDDGGTDDTHARVRECTGGLPQPIVYVWQPNAGAGAARNRGIELARGEFVAFCDSDDLWLPHHLAAAIDGLRAAPELDALYGAACWVELETGATLVPHAFYPDGRPHPFMRLAVRRHAAVRLLDDPRTCRCAIRHGLRCAVQATVFRRSLFDHGLRFPDVRLWQDQAFLIHALKAGARFGYLDDVHLLYRVHDGNSCLAGRPRDLERGIAVWRTVVAAQEALLRSEPFTAAERWALRRRVADACFWNLGYRRLWQAGRTDEALAEFAAGLRAWPWDPRMWKTYGLARLRRWLGVAPRGDATTCGHCAPP